ncbi:MAG: Crp/Fnr family transcriptional regulator [Burkholderiaceae bacterium]
MPSIAALSESLLQELQAMGRSRSFAKDTIVVVEGEPADVLYIVLSGNLRVYVSDAEGREAELNRLGPGEYFGELMLGSKVRTASVRSLNQCQLCMIRRREFEAFLASRPDMAFHLIQTMIDRIRILTRSVQCMSLMNVHERVVRLLMEKSMVDESGRRYALRQSQQRFADQVGASKGMINKVLKELVKTGWISVLPNRIEIRQDLSSLC